MARRHVELCRRFPRERSPCRRSTPARAGWRSTAAKDYPIERQPFPAEKAKLLVNQLRWSRSIDRWCRGGGGLVHLGNIRPCGYAVGLGTLLTGTPYLIYVNGGDLLRERRFARQAAGAGRAGTSTRARSESSPTRAGPPTWPAKPSRSSAPGRCPSPRSTWAPIRTSSPPRRDTGALRRRLGLGAAPLLLTVARLVPHKGQDVALRALAALAARVSGSALPDGRRGSRPAATRGARPRSGRRGTGDLRGGAHRRRDRRGLRDRDALPRPLADRQRGRRGGLRHLLHRGRGERRPGGGRRLGRGALGGSRRRDRGWSCRPPTSRRWPPRCARCSPTGERRRAMGAAARRAAETHYNWDRVAAKRWISPDRHGGRPGAAQA